MQPSFLHWYGFSPVCSLKWVFKFPFSKNAFLQFWIGQQNSLLPECLLRWTCSLYCRAYDLVQPSNVQVYFLTFKWISEWFLRWPFDINALPQPSNEHKNGFCNFLKCHMNKYLHDFSDVRSKTAHFRTFCDIFLKSICTCCHRLYHAVCQSFQWPLICVLSPNQIWDKKCLQHQPNAIKFFECGSLNF